MSSDGLASSGTLSAQGLFVESVLSESGLADSDLPYEIWYAEEFMFAVVFSEGPSLLCMAVHGDAGEIVPDDFIYCECNWKSCYF